MTDKVYTVNDTTNSDTVACYNCGSIEKDFYLVKGDHLVEDLDYPETLEGEEVVIQICKNCGACQ